MEQIIEQLLSPDTNLIKMASGAFEKLPECDETYEQLCNVMVSHQNSAVRQYAAVLLRKKLDKECDYQHVPPNALMHIKSYMLNAIFAEKENNVRGSMTQCYGCVLRHEACANAAWVDGIVRFLAAVCASPDARTVEIATFVLWKLNDETPETFVARFPQISGVVRAALSHSNGLTKNPFSATMMFNILATMNAMAPVILSNEQAQRTFKEAVPNLLDLLKRYADECAIEHFTIALEVLQSMTEYTPMLLNLQIRRIVEVGCFISANVHYDPEVRIKALTFLPLLITERKKFIVKLKLIEPMLEVLFEIMATEPEADNADEFFAESDCESILAAANVVIDTLAINMPAEKIITPLLSLLEPALQNQHDDLRRRAAYIVLATIAEGCRETICNKYLEAMLNILKNGFNDAATSVRSAALYALGQFSEQLQPEIADYAGAVLPQLLKFLQEVLLAAQQPSQKLEEKLIERLFYALEAFCEHMQKGLEPYMPRIMAMALTALGCENFPQRIHMLVMELIDSAAQAYYSSLLPWFQPLIQQLLPFLCEENLAQPQTDELRLQAISTLAQTARNVGSEFRPYAQQTLTLCLQKLEASVDPDERRALFNLIGALAAIVGEEFSTVLPMVLRHIKACLRERSVDAVGVNKSNAIWTEIDSDVDDEENEVFLGDNPYLHAKDQAVYTIKVLAENCPNALLRYNGELYAVIGELIDTPCTELCCSCLDAGKTIVIKWFEQNEQDHGAKQALRFLLLKLLQLVNSAEKVIVIEALGAIVDLLDNLGEAALPMRQLREAIVQLVRNGLTYKLACQLGNTGGELDDNFENIDIDDIDKDNSVLGRAVIESSAELLATLGRAISKQEYYGYFAQLEPLVLQQLKHAFETESHSLRAFLLGVLAECYARMGAHVAAYFQPHLRLLIAAAKARNARIRQNAILALGELVHAAGEAAFDSFPKILSTLSEVLISERKRGVVDSILGTLARLVLTNVSLLPMDQVLPVMLQNLPIVEHKEECDVVIECFQLLFQSMPELMKAHIIEIVAVAMQSTDQQYCDAQLAHSIIVLFQQIKTIYPQEYQQALANPLIATLLSTLLEQSGDFAQQLVK